MKYVYLLQSIPFPDRYFVGVTQDLELQLTVHNTGKLAYTAQHMPWQMKTYIAFTDDAQAAEFEKFLKSPAGRGFVKKRLNPESETPTDTKSAEG